ncbi:hypothetical protein AMECASPLE_031492 [Ameca splendens]|uniref:Secreted protein n=2 Tax=Goodeidae TaxID=28758 RepID=A0ABV0Z694_9TELE
MFFFFLSSSSSCFPSGFIIPRSHSLPVLLPLENDGPQSCRLSFCACRSFALKAYFVSCSCSMISLASFISTVSWLYFSASSWFSRRSSTTSWLSSSFCFPQCSFSCSISESVSSMRFTRLSSFSLDILLKCFIHLKRRFNSFHKGFTRCVLRCLSLMLVCSDR